VSEQADILIEREFPSSRDELKELPKILEAIRDRCPISDDQFYNLVIAMTEAVNNAIVHGNELDPDKQVRYRIECRSGGVLCVVEDEGPGFEVEEVADPLDPANILREGGRGVFLIQMLMQEFRAERIEGGMRISFFCPAT
jgi:serine/threonine-protein kinase RsbW